MLAQTAMTTDTVEPDLGWVLDLLHQSLNSTTLALRRFVRDAELSRGSDMAALDASQLRIASQQLHQAVDTLEMVGQKMPAKMLRGMESLTQKFIQHPECCSVEAALTLEHASFALADYLEGILKGRAYSAVALFPQYRDVLELAGKDRIHPADLWLYEWQWIEIPVPDRVKALPYDSPVKTLIDGHILNVVKSWQTSSAQAMCDICLGFAKYQQDLHVRVFWGMAAAYFEAVSLGLCKSDVHAKRAASRILLQYRTLLRGELVVSEQLVLDLLFFCAQSVPGSTQTAEALTVVRQAYGLTHSQPVCYDKPQFGLFDPALLVQARQRISTAAKTWSDLSGGDISRIKMAADQFSLVTDSITKLYPDSADLAASLSRSIEMVVRSALAPSPLLAMEVATTVLFLEAVVEAIDPSDEIMTQRSRTLTQRLDRVNAGEQPEPLDAWMEELYRHVSDRQNMGSVVEELRTTLAEIETTLDAFFRHPDDTVSLSEVPRKLAQMRGVFSILGLDQAALATLRLRDRVEQFLVEGLGADAAHLGVCEKLVNSLGTLGFLVDMLAYQRELAKKLFVYDTELDEFRSLMGRQPVEGVATQAEEVPVPTPLPDAQPHGQGRWVEAIAANHETPWATLPFHEAQDSLPLENIKTERVLPGDPVVIDDAVSNDSEEAQPDFVSTQMLLQNLPQDDDPETETSHVEQVEPEPDTVISPDDQIKVIGTLRVGMALYNIFLNEADEWSHRLLTELQEWLFKPDKPLADSTVGWAHSLAGSSANVGFTALSELASALEHALVHAQRCQTELRIPLFVEVAEDIRHLLHQFAAGFLKQSDSHQLQALSDILEIDPRLDDATNKQSACEQSDAIDPVDEPVLTTPQPLPIAPPETPTALPTETDVFEPQAALPDDDATDVGEVLDVELFPLFEEESQELLPQLSAGLKQWEACPDSLDARQNVLRMLHMFKGSARLVGAIGLADMAHRMESDVEQIDSESGQIEHLLTRLDDIQDHLQSLKNAPVEAAASVPIPTPPRELSDSPIISIRSQLLDRMVNQTGEVIMTQSRLESHLGQLRGTLGELTGHLDRLRSQLGEIESQSESQMQSRLAQTLDPLELDLFTRVQELTRMMAKSVHDVATLHGNLQQTVVDVEADLNAQARQTIELQHDLLHTRRVEFDSIEDHLHSVVRQAADDAGKQVKLNIVGGSLEMDCSVLDRMVPTFEHLLRHAVTHGIEDVATRLAVGKPVVGSITIALAQQGNDVSVTFSDDGAGLDMDRLRARALALGQILPDLVLSDDQVIQLIFTSGHLTAEDQTELAGGGIGMDGVFTEVNALGGRIESGTQRGLGTHFKLVLPFTTAVTQVVMLRLGEALMGVPSNLVELVRRVSWAEVKSSYQTHHFEHNGQALAFYWAGSLLQVTAKSAETTGKTATVAIICSAGQRVAVHVDEVLGTQELVVKNLGPQLSRLPGLVAMSVLASGAVVLIYNPVTLATLYGSQAHQFSEQHLSDMGGTVAADTVGAR